MKGRKRLVFDFETKPFSKRFHDATSRKGRLKHAPKMRIGGVYDVANKTYTFYGPADASALIAHLKSADEIISYNGKNFDLLVLKGAFKFSA
jgi:hypothetical protein